MLTYKTRHCSLTSRPRCNSEGFTEHPAAGAASVTAHSSPQVSTSEAWQQEATPLPHQPARSTLTSDKTNGKWKTWSYSPPRVWVIQILALKQNLHYRKKLGGGLMYFCLAILRVMMPFFSQWFLTLVIFKASLKVAYCMFMSFLTAKQ